MLIATLYQRLISLPRRSKQLLVIGVDTLISLMTTWLAFCLRLGTPNIDWTWEQLSIFAFAPALAIPIFVRLGLYRAIFRYSGFGAAMTVVRAVSIYAVVFVLVMLALALPNVPRTVAVIQPVLFAWSVLALRSMSQLALRDVADNAERQVLLIFGAGVTGIRTAASLLGSMQFRIVGFIDDDSAKVGREIMGRRVVSRQQAETLIENGQVNSILLALPAVSRALRNGILEWLRPLSVHVQSVPSTAEIASGRVTLNDLRELDIEDVLGRDPIPEFDAGVHHDVQGKVIAVTGAGGSIGSELCRQLLRAGPVKLLLLDSSEYALYCIHAELVGLVDSLPGPVELVPLLCNVRYRARVEEIIAAWRPAIVYHAAAYKHVPLVEHNPMEGVANNALGTLVVAQACVRNAVGKLVLISTDKAVRPTNIMGASKRLAEIILQALAAETMPTLLSDDDVVINRTLMTMVRFGNVLGSSGSVVPLFRAQLAAGGPLTVTHKEVVRYFMTIPEAVQLVLQAGAMAKGGELFLLDMGEPVRIYDLARRVVELSGSTVRDDDNPDGHVEIRITGLRPGEKLYEELLIDAAALATEHPRIMCAHERMFPWKTLRIDLEKLCTALAKNDTTTMRLLLANYVDGFAPEQSVDWVEMAENENRSRNIAASDPIQPSMFNMAMSND